MKRFTDAIVRILRGLFAAIERFPLTVICLACAAALICYMISLHRGPELIIQKLMFTFLLGSFLGVAAQFIHERFEQLARRRLAIYVIAAVLTGGYFLILRAAPNISFEVVIRTVVAVFAMFCAFVWVPSYKGKFDFNAIALIHFKALLTSVLYSAVLSAGCAAIIASIDTLLFNISEDAYPYTMTIIWVLFATIYYLSLLPRFNSDHVNDRQYAEHMGEYPRFLEILISYIAIPLLTVYTLVLAAYFVKILVTWHWPSGQLGVMVLAYSAAGLMIYILASRLENRFAALYRRLFPKVLIPIVMMQLVSVAIRLNAYGVTESRYYVTLFGIFSMVCGILLSFKPVSKNGIIALLAAGIAIFSVIPPVDAFTVSRNSQVNRLEKMLAAEGVLVDGKLSPRADVSTNLKTETTSILSYLERRSYIKSVPWLPDDFKTYENMKKTLGFEPSYAEQEYKNFFAGVDRQKPLSISGYDICVNAFLNSRMEKSDQPSIDFELNHVKYRLDFDQTPPQAVRVSVKDAEGTELVGTDINDFVQSISKAGNMPKETLPPEAMTLETENHGYKLRIVFQDVNVYYGNNVDPDYDYAFLVMFGLPATEQ